MRPDRLFARQPLLMLLSWPGIMAVILALALEGVHFVESFVRIPTLRFLVLFLMIGLSLLGQLFALWCYVRASHDLLWGSVRLMCGVILAVVISYGALMGFVAYMLMRFGLTRAV